MRDGFAARLEALGAEVAAGPAAPHDPTAPSTGGAPGLTVSPRSEETTAAVVRLCREARVAIVPAGGGTLDVRRASGETVFLSTARLADLVEHDDANLTATAQGGMTLEGFQRAVRPRGQFAALDAPYPDRATLGGVAAVNLNGYRRTAYRAIRDLVLGMRVVTGAGEIVKAGGKVVKNVAGYDMCKLFIGSQGTLGIITQITARLEPLPEADLTLAIRFRDGTHAGAAPWEGPALAAGLALARSPWLPTAVALLNGAAAARLLGGSDGALLVRLEGFSAVVARQEREIHRMGGSVERLDPAASTETWEGLLRMGREGPGGLFTAMLPRASLPEAWAALRSAAPEAEAAADLLGAALWAAPVEDGFSVAARAVAGVAHRTGGHVRVVRRPPGGAASEVDGALRPSPGALALMRGLKAAFDPDGILSPGAFPFQAV